MKEGRGFFAKPVSLRAAFVAAAGTLGGCANIQEMAGFEDCEGGQCKDAPRIFGKPLCKDENPETRGLGWMEMGHAGLYSGRMPDLHDIRIRFCSHAYPIDPVVPASSTGEAGLITFWKKEGYNPEFFSSNYVLASVDAYSAFIHELGHIAQSHTGNDIECTDKDKAYHAGKDRWSEYYFRLGPDTDISVFCEEKQAETIDQYARRFLHWAGPAPTTHYLNTLETGGDTPETDALLARAVERFLPAAQPMRLSMPERREEMNSLDITPPPAPKP